MLLTRSRFRVLLLGVFSGLPWITVLAQPSTDLAQARRDLEHDGVIMNISAHPDDEDGATLAYYRMHFGVTTTSVLFTRGEGGQNEKGVELYEELGVLRSRETEAAGEILGARVRFLNFKDFGYSKTATEAFRIWGGQREALRRLVYMIRLVQPDILFTNHNTIDGHGHHQAAAITTLAAFDASADPAMFPEQLRLPGVALWQPKKLYFRVRPSGTAEPAADVANAVLDRDSLRAKGYIDIASEALQRHRTQGMDRADLRRFSRGKNLYRLVRTSSLFDPDTTTFFGGIGFDRDPDVAALAPIRAQVRWLAGPRLPEAAFPVIETTLREIDSALAHRGRSALADRMLRTWEEEVERVGRLAAGFSVVAAPTDPLVTPGQRTRCTVRWNADLAGVSVDSIALDLPPGWSWSATPRVRGRDEQEFSLVVGDSAVPTRPEVTAQYRPLESRTGASVHVAYRWNGHHLKAEEALAVEVAPPLVVSADPPVVRISPSHPPGVLHFTVTVQNHMPHKVAGRLSAVLPPGWRADIPAYVIGAEDSIARVSVAVQPPAEPVAGHAVLAFHAGSAVATVGVAAFEVAVAPGLRVGIVKSYDDALEQAVRELQVEHRVLSDEDLAHADLSLFTTIVIDIRAYLVREALRANAGRLIDYARGGGNLVVMYQRDREWSPAFAPYPFDITRDRVCADDAPVRVLLPRHPLALAPNPIGSEDWEGWKQERAVYFPRGVGPEYERILSSADPDEEPLTTGLLVAQVGRGSYIYTSFVWYRQLKEYVPGAYRWFANMLSYPRTRR
jgi:LmbE family N-acetylglucosaminyl deacetylase